MKKLILKTIFASYLASTTAHGMDDAFAGAAAPTTSPVVAAGFVEAGDVKSQILALLTPDNHALIPAAVRLQASFAQLTPAAELLLPEILASLQSVQEASTRNGAFKAEMEDAQAESDRTSAQIEATTTQAISDAEQASNQAQSEITAASERALQGIVDADARAQSEIAITAQKAESDIQENAASTARQIEEESARTGQQIEERAASTAREIETSALATKARIDEETSKIQNDFDATQAYMSSMKWYECGFTSKAAFDDAIAGSISACKTDQDAIRGRLLASEGVKKQGLLETQASATAELLAAEKARKQALLDTADIENARLLAEASVQKTQSLQAAALRTQELQAEQEIARAAALDAEQKRTAEIIAQLQISLQAQRMEAEAASKVHLAGLGSEAGSAVLEMTRLTEILNDQITDLEAANTQKALTAVDVAVRAERQQRTAALIEAQKSATLARAATERAARELLAKASVVRVEKVPLGTSVTTYTTAASGDAVAAAQAAKTAAFSSLDTTASLGADERTARAAAETEAKEARERAITDEKAARIAELQAATASASSTVLAVTRAFDMSEWEVQTAAISKLHPTIQEKLNAVLSDIETSGVYIGLKRVQKMTFRTEFSTLIADPSDAKIASYRAKHFKK